METISRCIYQCCGSGSAAFWEAGSGYAWERKVGSGSIRNTGLYLGQIVQLKMNGTGTGKPELNAKIYSI